MLDPIYITAMIIAAMFTISLTIIKIISMRRDRNGSQDDGPKAEIRNLKKEVNKKQDRGLCNERYENVKVDLQQGHEQFATIMQSINDLTGKMGKVEERVDFLARREGFGKG